MLRTQFVVRRTQVLNANGIVSTTAALNAEKLGLLYMSVDTIANILKDQVPQKGRAASNGGNSNERQVTSRVVVHRAGE